MIPNQPEPDKNDENKKVLFPLLDLWYRFIGRLDIQTTLIFSLVIILVVAMGITGILVYINSQGAVTELAGKLEEEISSRITDHLDYYLMTPHHLNQLCQDSINLGDIDIHDSEDIKRHFLELSYQHPTVQAICYGNEADGNYSIVSIVGKPGLAGENERFWAVSPLPMRNNSYEEYRIDRDGRILERTLSYPNYDPRTRPWYQTAKSANKPVWIPVYMWMEVGAVSVDALLPVHNKQGVFLGVLDSSLTLSGISDFLKNLQISKTGQAFIIERSGDLIASSTITEPYTKVNDELVRLSAFKSNDSVIQKATQNLIHPGESSINITQPKKFTFSTGQTRYFTSVTPYMDSYGLDWMIITAIPESDIMERINANNQITIILIISSIIGAIIFCFLLARWITVPIISINNAARALASGEWIPVSSLDRKDELGELSHSFKFMADQLRESFSALQISEEQYLNLFQSSTDAILILEGLTVQTLNKAAIELLSIEEADVKGKEIQSLFGHVGPFIADLLKSDYKGKPDLDQENETVYPSPSGERILKIHINPVETTKGIIYQVQLRDITEQKKACLAYAEREAFRQALMQMEAILNLLPDPTFIIDNQGRISLWNQAMETLSRIKSEVMVGKGNFEYSIPFYGKRRRVLIDYALHADSTAQDAYPEIDFYRDHLTAQFWMESQEGKRFFLATAGRLHDSRGNLIGAIETIRDMTEMKKAHDALLLSNKKLNLLSQVSRHDVLNQITILNGLLYLVDMDYSDPELKKLVDKMVHIVKIIRDQIDFTKVYQKIGATEPIWLKPSEIFEQQAGKFKDRLIEFIPVPSEIEINADQLFEKVIYNLIDNSIRHGERVTSITLSIVVTEAGAEIIYEDNGAGICSEDKAIIFEPGFGKNSGYGLFLIKEILSITDISIQEIGIEGTGVRFVMTVPPDRYRVRE